MNNRFVHAIIATVSAALILSVTLFSDVNPIENGYISHNPITIASMEKLVNPDDPSVTRTLVEILSSPQVSAFDDIVNWVATNISDVSDEKLHGVSDYWQTPAETLSLKAGDCEDYAILLCSLLRAYGVPSNSIFVAVGTKAGGTGHALLVERYYSDIWRKVDVQGGLKISLLDETGIDTNYLHIDYCFNDKEGFRGPPVLPAGVYEFQLGVSYHPWEAGAARTLTRNLKAGQTLEATVNWLPDTYLAPYNRLFIYPWSVKIYNGDGRGVYNWSGTDIEHSVTFSAEVKGDYRIEILKRDDAPRCLRLSISPDNWKVEPLPNDVHTNEALYAANLLTSHTPAVAQFTPPAPELFRQVIGLINEQRMNNFVPQVYAGTNSAAQAHALDMLTNGFLSHYGTDGLNSYMRYTLAGGTGYEGESITRVALHWSGDKDSAYQSYLVSMLEQAEQSLIRSPGDLKNILDKEYRHVNIGIAYDDSYLYLVQQFETDYVTFDSTPEIQGGILSLAGRLEAGIVPSQVQIYYDPSPGKLSSSQLSYAPNSIPGQPVALIRSMSGLPYQSDGRRYTGMHIAIPIRCPLTPRIRLLRTGFTAFSRR